MDHAQQFGLRMLVQVTLDRPGVDGLVVRHLQLVQVGPEGLEPVAHALAENARHQVEHRHAGPHQGAGRRLEAENGLALHQDDLVPGAEQLADLGLRAPEGVQEDRIVVIGDRAAERGERPGGGSGRPGGEGEVRIAHGNTP